MIIKRPSDIRPSEITDEAVYMDRRHFLRAAGFAALGAAAAVSPRARAAAEGSQRKIEGLTQKPPQHR